jgi:hypothetical protein
MKTIDDYSHISKFDDFMKSFYNDFDAVVENLLKTEKESQIFVNKIIAEIRKWNSLWNQLCEVMKFEERKDGFLTKSTLKKDGFEALKKSELLKIDDDILKRAASYLKG